MCKDRIDIFRCQKIKDEWNTKEGTGKSMKNALYIQYCGMPKGTFRVEVASNSKKIKHIA